MNWLYDMALTKFVAPYVDSTWQRVTKNPKTTLGGGVVAVVFEAVIAALESQGCDLSQVKPMGLAFLAYGAYSTERNKAIVEGTDGRPTTVQVDHVNDLKASEADDEHARTGQS